MNSVNKKGFALMPLIIAIIIIGALIGAGLTLVESRAKKARYDRTGEILTSAAQSVIAWSLANGRLPDDTTFPSVVSKSTDDWGRSLIYIYDGNLTAVSSGGLCGRSSTGLSYGAATNTAFLIISGAEDMAVNTTPAVTGAFAGNVVSGTADLLRAVSLEELRNQTGCFSYTAGRLRILNNELPKAVSGVSYSAAIYAEGGILPYTVWNAIGMPTGLTFNTVSAVISGTPTTPGSFPVTIQVTDTGGNTASRTYNLQIS